METHTRGEPRPPTEFARTLGARLKAQRRARGWSLAKLEQESGRRFKAVVVGSYERGERRVFAETLYELAEFYDLPLSALLPDGGPGGRQTMMALEDVVRVIAGMGADAASGRLPAPRNGDGQS